MNGCHSKNIDNNDNSSIESNPLVAITDMGPKIEAYVAAIKELVTSSPIFSGSHKKNIARVEELEAMVKYRREQLSLCVEHYGICKTGLAKAVAGHNATLISLEVKLAQLKAYYSAIEPASIITEAERVAESVRSQISRALDFAYS